MDNVHIISVENQQSAINSWKNANDACFKYLCQITNSDEGKNAYVGDRLPSDKGNIWCFLIHGENLQPGIYAQCPTPMVKNYVAARLIGQFLTLDDAFIFEGMVRNNMHAYRNTNNTSDFGGQAHMVNRGLGPNVNMFELIPHSTLRSEILTLNDSKNQMVWILEINFRVEYNNRID